MSERERVLSALQRREAEAGAPDLDEWTRRLGPPDGDAIARFASVLDAVGGRSSLCDRSEVRSQIEEIAGQVDAKMVRNEIEDPDSLSPHDYREVDLLVVSADLAVAENGAVWVSERNIQERAALFLCQHLVVLVECHRVVYHMHEAYAAVEVDAGSFGLFISGPSKTADIEQALVIGAHGPRSLNVILISQ